MFMNLIQTKIIGLTMQFDLKVREYNKLCDTLDRLKETNINSNDKRLFKLKQLFQKNYDEIVGIEKEIIKLKETGNILEKQKLEKYDSANLFKKSSCQNNF